MRDFREGDHLPNRSESGEPPDPAGLPRQRRGVTPQMHGRYPDYDVLEQSSHWDEETRKVVRARLDQVPSIRFFDPAEARTIGALCDAVTAQDDEPRVPVLPFVDEKLHEGELDGYQYVDLPDDRELWRLIARGLDESARRSGARSFAEAPPEAQHEMCHAFAKGELRGEVWDELNVSRAWKVATKAIVTAFYSHPWAWNEMGFGGPAYPRGYAAFGSPHLDSEAEGWEPAEAFEVDPVRDTKERGLE
jgi:Gluconate 2-dehydrogenase subunit 3